MTRTALALLCAILVAPALAAPPEVPGQAVCDRSGHGGPCHIAWNLTTTPRTYYWVQQFDPREQRWNSLGAPVTEAYATRAAPVAGGFLYRAYACNDLAASADCIGSTVYWAPLRPRSVGDIPDVMPDKQGRSMTIEKDADLETQTHQYNVYSLVQMLERIDLASMPPMTPPPDTDPDPSTHSDLTPDDLIHVGIYQNYEGMRASAGKTSE